MKKAVKTLFALLGVSLLAGCSSKEIYNNNDFFGAKAVLVKAQENFLYSARELQFSGSCMSADYSENDGVVETNTYSYFYQIDLKNLKAHIKYSIHNEVTDANNSANNTNALSEGNVYFIYDYKTGFGRYQKNEGESMFGYMTSNNYLLEEFSYGNPCGGLYMNKDDMSFEDYVRSYLIHQINNKVTSEVFYGFYQIDYATDAQQMVDFDSEHDSNFASTTKFDVDAEKLNLNVDSSATYDIDYKGIYGEKGNVKCDVKYKLVEGLCKSSYYSYEDNFKTYTTYVSEEENTLSEAKKRTYTYRIDNEFGDASYGEPDYSSAIMD